MAEFYRLPDESVKWYVVGITIPTSCFSLSLSSMSDWLLPETRSPQLEGPLGRFSGANRLPRELVDAPGLSVFRRHLDNALHNLL